MSTINHYKFEQFIISILKIEAQIEKKEIIIEDLNMNLVSDAFAPDGLFEFNVPVYIYIKSSISANGIDSILTRIRVHRGRSQSSNNVYDFMLLVFTFEMNQLANVTKNVIIYDKRIVLKYIEKYPIEAYSILSRDERLEFGYSLDSDNIKYVYFINKNKRMLSQLSNTLNSNSGFTLVLGAGISVSPGSFQWDEIIDKLREELSKSKNISISDSLLNLIGNTNLINSSFFKEKFSSEDDFYNIIYKALYDGIHAVNTKYSIYAIAELIKAHSMRRNFNVLTYNFDNHLEIYLDNIGVDYNTVFSSNIQNPINLPIYHVHGFLPYDSTGTSLSTEYTHSIHFTENDYNRLYNDPYTWEIVEQLKHFYDSTCLFVGLSLKDSNIRRLVAMTHTNHAKHYAILSRESLAIRELLLAEESFQKLGINVIWADNFDNIAEKIRKLF
jgi:hypothetical protein